MYKSFGFREFDCCDGCDVRRNRFFDSPRILGKAGSDIIQHWQVFAQVSFLFYLFLFVSLVCTLADAGVPVEELSLWIVNG